MYIPITRIFNDTSAWMTRHPGTASHSTGTPLLNYQQEAIDPTPLASDHVTTTVVLMTSTKVIPHSTISVLKSHIPVPPRKASLVPASTTRSSTEFPLITISSAPELTGSVPPSDSASLILPITSLLPAAESKAIQPTHTSSRPFAKDEGKHIGQVVGLVVGAVVGAILLGLLIYWIHACYRGINVCNCFSGTDDEDDRVRIQTHQLQSYPMSGIGAAPRIDRLSRPSISAQGVSDVHGSRLQRKCAPISVSQPLAIKVEQ